MMAYIGGDQVVLFGGWDSPSTNDDETWVYDLSDNIWTQDTSTTRPSARGYHTLCETSMDGSTYPVMFGGNEIVAFDDETWTYSWVDQELVTVTKPHALTVWKHGETDTKCRWSGALGTQVLIELFQGGSYIDVYHDWTPNTGVCVRSDEIPVSWGTGTDYIVKVTDDLGYFGWSEQFEIKTATKVRRPKATTLWAHGETETKCTWRGSPGTQVMVEVYKGGSYLDLYHDWTPNTGVCIREEEIPVGWGLGTDYQVKVVDDLGYYGWSEPFEIAKATIKVRKPNASTTWTHGQTDRKCKWRRAPGSQVMVELFKGESYIDIFHDWTPNNGVCIREDEIPVSWGTGTDFQVRVIDDMGSEGWSADFTIQGAKDARPGMVGASGLTFASPALGRTTVQFTIGVPGPVTVEIYDVTGRKVRTLVDAPVPPGDQTVTWDGTSDNGEPVAPGIYTCRLTTGNLTENKRIVLLRSE
jgi:hypothetical protein